MSVLTSSPKKAICSQSETATGSEVAAGGENPVAAASLYRSYEAGRYQNRSEGRRIHGYSVAKRSVTWAIRLPYREAVSKSPAGGASGAAT